MRWFDRLMNRGKLPASLEMARAWEQRATKLATKLATHQDQLNDLLAKIQSLSHRMEEDLHEAEHVQHLHETAMEALRSENKILSEVTVPTLVAQHKIVLQRVEADTAIQVRRQVASMPQPMMQED